MHCLDGIGECCLQSFVAFAKGDADRFRSGLAGYHEGRVGPGRCCQVATGPTGATAMAALSRCKDIYLAFRRTKPMAPASTLLEPKSHLSNSLAARTRAARRGSLLAEGLGRRRGAVRLASLLLRPTGPPFFGWLPRTPSAPQEATRVAAARRTNGPQPARAPLQSGRGGSGGLWDRKGSTKKRAVAPEV